MTTQQWEKCLTKSKRVVQIFVAIGHYNDSGTTTDMTVRVLAEEKGSDLMLWGGVFFLFIFAIVPFLAHSIIYLYLL